MKKIFLVLFLLLFSVSLTQSLASEGQRCSDEVLLPFVGPCLIDSHCPGGYTCDGGCIDAPSCSSGLECNNFICETETSPPVDDITYGECYDGRCCDEGQVFCDSSHDVCGDSAWCANYNNPQLSCRLSDPDWCCDDSGYIIDYTSANSNSGCCPPDYPFYYKAQNNCWSAPVAGADNYYTRLSQCDYFWNPITSSYDIDENSCTGDEVRECKLNEIAQWISGWRIKGNVLGECGVECVSDSNCPADEVLNSFCNVNQIMKMTREYNCGTNSQCVATDTTTVIETCPLSCEMVEPEQYRFYTMTTTTTQELVPQCSSCAENEIIQIAEEYHICRDGTYQRVLDLVEFSDEEQQALLEQIKLLELTVEEKAELISQLNLNINEQVELINQLEVTLNEKILIVQTLTSNLEEQTNLISQLELNLQEKIIIVQALTQNIDDQAVIIQQLATNADEQAQIIIGLNLNIQEQAQIISNMELTVLEQSIIIENLNLNIQEQAIVINNLNVNLALKIELISQLEITTQEQQDLIDQMAISFADQQTIINALNVTIQDDVQQIANLQLTISESAEYITSLELTVSQQSELVNQLQLSTVEQASLISQLQLNNEEKAQLISNLNLRLDEQADLITLMNLELDDDAEIIRNLNLQLDEESELINQLNLNIDAQLEIIKQLELKISEEKELVTQLRLTIEEQLRILEELQKYRDTPTYTHFWDDYKAYIISIGSLILLIIGGLFYKKKTK